MDECNPRQFREMPVSSLEDMGLPHFGAKSHLVLDAQAPSFQVQDDLQASPGDTDGGAMQAGPQLGTKRRRRERFGGPPPSHGHFHGA